MKKILTFAAIAAALSLSSCAGTGNGKTEGYVGYVPLTPLAALGDYCGGDR